MSVMNPLTRNDVRNIWKDVFRATQYLTVFIEWQIGYYFESTGYECKSKNDEENKEGFNLELLILAHEITIFNHQIVDFLQNEHPQYQRRFIREVAPKEIYELDDLMSKSDLSDNYDDCPDGFKSLRDKINYAWEISDGINSALSSLKCLYEILTNIEDLIEDSSDLEQMLDYQITFNDTLEEMGYKASYLDEDEESTDVIIAPFAWYGTPSELALLFSTLVDNGYIEPPTHKNGKINNSKFSTKIVDHFNLTNGTLKSVTNSLFDNSITPDNQFHIAMSKVPRNRRRG